MEFIRRSWGWIVALIVLILGIVFQQNIEDFSASEHLNTLIPRLIAWWSVFRGTWWGAAVSASLLTSVFWFVVYSISNLVIARSRVKKPFAILFDPKNPDRHFWGEYIDQSEDPDALENDFRRDKFMGYRVKIVNRTDRTIRNVAVTASYANGNSSKKKLMFADADHCDLHPGAPELVEVYAYNELHHEALTYIQTFRNPWEIEIIVSGDNANTCRQRIQIDATKVPAISLVKS